MQNAGSMQNWLTAVKVRLAGIGRLALFTILGNILYRHTGGQYWRLLMYIVIIVHLPWAVFLQIIGQYRLAMLTVFIEIMINQ